MASGRSASRPLSGLVWAGVGGLQGLAGCRGGAVRGASPRKRPCLHDGDSCRFCVQLSRESSGGLNRKTKTKEHVIIMYTLLEPTLILASVLGQICRFSQIPY